MIQITLYQNAYSFVDYFVKTVGSLTGAWTSRTQGSRSAQDGVPTLTLVHTSRAKAHRLEEKGN
jgi:hypothetical protein